MQISAVQQSDSVIKDIYVRNIKNIYIYIYIYIHTHTYIFILNILKGLSSPEKRTEG